MISNGVERYYNAKEAARFLGIARMTFYRNWLWPRRITGEYPGGRRTAHYKESDLRQPASTIPLVSVARTLKEGQI